MVDVLLAHSYFLRYDPKQQQKMRPYPPLATLFAAAYLRAAGYRVALFDAMLSEGEHAFADALHEHQPALVAIYEDNFNFLSKMCLTRMREAACTMIGMARASGCAVVVSGADMTDHPELYLQAGAHAALLGEPDHTLLEVLRALEVVLKAPASHYAVALAGDLNGAATVRELDVSLDTIPGLALPDGDGGVRITARRPVERFPDVFPEPAWDLVDIERYRAAWIQAHGYFSLNMVSTRGCPFHCNWCAKPIWGQRYAMRSPAAVAAELARLKREFQPDHIWFADDIFGLRPQWVAAFADEVAARDAAVPFMIQSRADLMSPEAVAGLQRAGCVEVWMGAESGSQQILDAMDKGTTVEELRTARQLLGEAGIRACFFIQFGYPGEELADIHATFELIRSTLPDNIGVSVSYPLPGTRFHRMVSDQLGPKTNWSDSGDLAMMFQGTYRSPFYRHLHRLIHRELEVRQQITARPPLNNGPWASDGSIRVTSGDLGKDLNDLAADWLRLGQLEATERSEMPTLLAKPYERIATPDLSKEYG